LTVAFDILSLRKFLSPVYLSPDTAGVSRSYPGITISMMVIYFNSCVEHSLLRVTG
jgi:hypothetical protein